MVLLELLLSVSLSVEPLPIVCVTGASGYFASELVGQLLDSAKYHVKATVRNLQNEERVGPLRNLAGAKERLTLLQANLLADGSFDECVHKAKYVFHTASPFFTDGIQDAQKELIDPALKGTTNLLQSVISEATVRPRVVITSSVAAVMGGVGDKQGCFDEEDWNLSSKLTSDNGLDLYRLSKKMAEEKAWALAKEHTLELVAINPAFIVGPPRINRKDGTSLENMKALLEGQEPPRGATPMVDVRDVAAAHILAAEIPEAAGHRFIMSTPTAVKKEEVARIVAEAHPNLQIVDLGDPVLATQQIFCSKTLESVLGLKLRPYSDSLRDMADAMLHHGSAVPVMKVGRSDL
jgi:nucleoside-diphosphate-sugar epimerase